MIVNVVCACIETFIEMSICIGIFVKAYGVNKKLNQWNKAGIGVLIFIAYIFFTIDKTINLISISAILIEVLIMTILLWLIIGNSFTKVVSWSFFNIVNIVLLKLPLFVVLGVIYDETLAEMNLLNNSHIWTKIISCLIFVILFIFYLKYSRYVVKYLRSIAHQQLIMLFVSGIEYIIILYIIYIGWHGFTIHTFLLTLCLIIMLFMFVVCLVVLLEYQITNRLNHILKSKENNMRANYILLNQEIERNRKINHDKKYDFEYLYHCFELKDFEKGLNYIRKKEDYYNIIQKNLTWTGYGSVDFLLNRAKARADEKKILFTIKVDIVEIPIEEYDFFFVLSNLLDNAIEASEQNKKGEGRIWLQILSLNNVFRIRLENTYLIEPIKRDKRFISQKSDSKVHGWGIENVKEIITKYDGNVNISYGNGIFLVDLITIQ